jgi:hypothetical protein
MQMDIGSMVPDGALDTAFFAYAGGVLPSLDGCFGVETYAISTRTLKRGLIICPFGLDPTHVIRWGSNGLAAIDLNGTIYILAGNFVSGP